MRNIAFAIATCALAACASQSKPPQPAAPVSHDELTNAKVPTTDTSPYGPSEYGYGSTLGSQGQTFQGNHYPGTQTGNRFPGYENLAPDGGPTKP